MKKIAAIVIASLLMGVFAKAQYVNIPDSNFRKYLIRDLPTCFNKDGLMDTTCDYVLTWNIFYLGGDSIRDLTGVQYFKGLTGLYCASNPLKFLPTLPNSLTVLDIGYDQFVTLPTLPNQLTDLTCQNNLLVSLPALTNSLVTINCSNNQLLALPTLPNSLTTINCSNNQIGSLPTLPNQLTSLACSSNKLSTLPIIPNSVTQLDFSYNYFTNLPTLPNSIQTLNCSYNLFNCLSTLPTSLQTLNILGTGIQCLPTGTTATVTPSGLPFCHNPCTVSNDFSNYVNIPDSAFMSFLINKYPSCMNKIGQMDTTCSGIVNETSVIYNGEPIIDPYIKDLTGIQYFKNLRNLNVQFNQIITLPTLPVNLDSLQCDENLLTSLPNLPNTLSTLSCSSNKLTSLPNLPDSLEFLLCSENQLTTLPNIPNSVLNLTCSNNQLTALPTLPESLTYFDCSGNKIATLPQNLPKNLGYLVVADNPIHYIPSLDSLNNLQHLYCGEDSNLLCLPKLPNSLWDLNLRGSGIQCLPNYTTGVNFINNGLPLCNPTNNAHQCSAYPTVLGRVFGDNNSNGIKDSDEFYIPYVPVNLNNGEISFSNDSGQFAITATDTGSFSLSATAPSFYKAVPNKLSFSLAEYNDVLTLNDIALQPTVIKDSLGIYIYPWQNAIPGRGMAYALEYRNYGTVNEDATISFTYDTSKLVFDTASVNLISHNGNTLVWKDTLGADYFGNNYYRNGFQYPVFYFKVKTKVAIGSGLLSSATIVSAKTSASITDSIAILDSYDPNSKEATPQLTTTQVADGDAIDYLIHFQNVGTATASAVVVADTLSNLLNPYVMQMIGISHDANVIIDNGIIYFQFLNINLPDSAANQLQSNGFVHFKLWPKSTVALGNTIKNNASIYFDYNNPVVTNTATTLIKNNPLPVSIISFQAHQVGDNLQIENDWTTANETNTAYYNVQRSTDGNNFSTIGRVVARGMGAGSYHFIDNAPVNGMNYYRLQSVDKDGAASYSKVVSVQFTVNSNQLTVYPNPAKENVIIKGNHIASVQVIDNMGRVVKVIALRDATNPVLSVSGLTAGVYHLRIQTTDGNVSGTSLMVNR